MASAMMVSMATSLGALRSNNNGVQNSTSSVVHGNAVKGFSGFNHGKNSVGFGKDRVEWEKKTVSNGGRVYCMKTWPPTGNRKYETLSYLPPLSEESMVKEVDYIVAKGWIPCLEFDAVGEIHRTYSRFPGYYDGRYWTMWKLPMFGCTDASQILAEIEECKKTYPNSYIRCLGFDNQKQTQCVAFLVHKPE